MTDFEAWWTNQFMREAVRDICERAFDAGRNSVGTPAENTITEHQQVKRNDYDAILSACYQVLNKDRPLISRDLINRISDQGVTVVGKNPEMVLVTILSRHGSKHGIVRNPRGRGYIRAW